MQAPHFWTVHGYGREAAPTIRTLLSPLGMLYAAATANRMKQAALYQPRVPTICVGNLTAGGTGKTPVACALLKLLTARGLKPFGLTRGYRRKDDTALEVLPSHSARDVGDEALLLARYARVIVSADRAAGARFAEAEGATAIVMDDGHQNPDLQKTLSFVVVDGAIGFGNEMPLPAGPLREWINPGLARADAIIVMGALTNERLEAHLAPLTVPVFRASLNADPDAAGSLKGRTLCAFAGIGRPQKFFDLLTECGANLVQALPYPNHHWYQERDLSFLASEAKRLEASLITTEKDWVRLPPDLQARVAVLPVSATFDDPAGLETFLDARLRTFPSATSPP